MDKDELFNSIYRNCPNLRNMIAYIVMELNRTFPININMIQDKFNSDCTELWDFEWSRQCDMPDSFAYIIKQLFISAISKFSSYP